MFPMDPELADAYYMNHYTNSNDTMYICTPYIPMRPDMHKIFEQLYPDRHSMVRCSIYQLGLLKRLSQRRQWSYLSAEQRLFTVATAVVVITGIFVE